MPKAPKLMRLNSATLIAIVVFTLHSIVVDVAAAPVEYVVRLPRPHTQMVDVSMIVRDVEAESLEFKLPAWRPGRYEILDPARDVRQARAFSGATGGDALPVEKIDKATWRVRTDGDSETMRFDYHIYANSLDDRTRHVDDTHAFLSGSAVFMYIPELRDEPVLVRIEAPDGWRTFTGLPPHPEIPNAFVAPNYDVLVDSPFEIGTHDVLEFDVDGAPHEIVIWSDAEYDAEKLKDDFAKIVREQTSIFGEMPYERYVFMIHAGKGAGGGTEHLNSTIMQTSRESLEEDDAYRRFLGLVAHEFFHTWNVKQLRPAGIHPYDYERENYTKLLWVAEGTTSYYDDLTLARSGLKDVDEYLDGLADSFESINDRPGRLVQSLEESSFDAWIKFNESSPDDINSEISFYSKGALVSLMLDMEIRSATGGEKSLDDVMRAMYEHFPLSGPGYTTRDLIDMIETIRGHDIEPFFDRYVRGVEEIDLASALNVVGLELIFEPATDDKGDDGDGDDEEDPGNGGEDGADDSREEPAAGGPLMKAYLGLNLRGARVSSIPADGPAYDAGFMVDDEIVAMNGRRVTSSRELDDRLEDHEPGDVVHLSFFRRDELRTIDVMLTGLPDGEWKAQPLENATPEQIAAYESWLQQDWPRDDDRDDDGDTGDDADDDNSDGDGETGGESAGDNGRD